MYSSLFKQPLIQSKQNLYPSQPQLHLCRPSVKTTLFLLNVAILISRRLYRSKDFIHEQHN